MNGTPPLKRRFSLYPFCKQDVHVANRAPLLEWLKGWGFQSVPFFVSLFERVYIPKTRREQLESAFLLVFKFASPLVSCSTECVRKMREKASERASVRETCGGTALSLQNRHCLQK